MILNYDNHIIKHLPVQLAKAESTNTATSSSAHVHIRLYTRTHSDVHAHVDLYRHTQKYAHVVGHEKDYKLCWSIGIDQFSIFIHKRTHTVFLS